MERKNNMPPEERFTRTVFGIVLIGSALVHWGRWVSLILGILFLVSAWEGYCATCEMYRKFKRTA